MTNQIIHANCFDILPQIKSKSIDLIITDPPYNISRYSYFNIKDGNPKFDKISIDFGEWDKDIIDLDILFKHYKRIVRLGGTVIIFYDVWKCNDIKEVASKYGFKQPRVCQWVKTNPVPINSRANYLSNSTEFFFTFVRSKKPTFNSVYDKGIYNYPICHGKERTDHPTQKPLALIKDLITKHSNPGDSILDTFGGSGTTAVACKELDRNYTLIEMDESYYDISISRISI